MDGVEVRIKAATVSHAGVADMTAALQQATRPHAPLRCGSRGGFGEIRIAGGAGDLAQAGPREPRGFRQSHRHGRKHAKGQRDGDHAVLLSADCRGCRSNPA